MMRIQRLAAAAALITFGSTALAAQSTAPGRVAYVALQAILQQTPGYTEAEQIWTTEVEGFRSEMTRLQNQLDSATAAFEQASVMLSASARQAERRKLDEMAQTLNGQVNTIQQRAATRQRELMDPIEQRVMAVVEGIRAEGNYSFVLDVTQPGNAIIAADTTLDLTARVIERLQAAGAGGTSGNP